MEKLRLEILALYQQRASMKPIIHNENKDKSLSELNEEIAKLKREINDTDAKITNSKKQLSDTENANKMSEQEKNRLENDHNELSDLNKQMSEELLKKRQKQEQEIQEWVKKIEDLVEEPQIVKPTQIIEDLKKADKILIKPEPEKSDKKQAQQKNINNGSNINWGSESDDLAELLDDLSNNMKKPVQNNTLPPQIHQEDGVVKNTKIAHVVQSPPQMKPANGPIKVSNPFGGNNGVINKNAGKIPSGNGIFIPKPKH